MKTNFKKVNYPKYKGLYDEDIKARMETAPENIDMWQELIREYDKLAETFSTKGIVCKDLCLCCPESMDKVIPADHIMCSNDDQYENNTDTAHTEPVRLKASIALEPAIGGSEPYSVTINGEYVNNNSDQGE